MQVGPPKGGVSLSKGLIDARLKVLAMTLQMMMKTPPLRSDHGSVENRVRNELDYSRLRVRSSVPQSDVRL